jgi:plasmid stabilization system protein ParE
VKLHFTRRAAGLIGKVIGDLAAPSPRSAASISRRIFGLLDLLLPFPLAGRLTAMRGVRRIL